MPKNFNKSVTKKKEKNTNPKNKKLRKKRYTSQKLTRNTQKGGADAGGAKPPTKKKILVTGLEEEDIDLDALIGASSEKLTSDDYEDIIDPVRDFLNTTQLKYFEDERKYNPQIKTLMNYYTIAGTSKITMDALTKIKTTPEKEIALINLHGALKKEEMTHRLPPNVMVCHLSQINTVNYIMEKQAFSIEKFLVTISQKQLESLFLHRTLHSTPENFKIYNQDFFEQKYNINYIIECLKRAQWYYPNQLYYDITLEADDDTTNTILHYYFDKKKLKLKKTPYANKQRTSLSEICEKLSGINSQKMYLIFNTSCQPFYYEPKKQDEEQVILNKLFIYTSIMYRLNLRIDMHLQSQLTQKKIIPLERKGKVPFCQDLNARFGSLYVPSDFPHNYYAYVKQVKDKTDNLHRKFPFFHHIETEMDSKKLKKKDIERFAVFFLGLSLNKKIKYYFKLVETLTKTEESFQYKNFQALLKKISEDRYFILNFLQMLEVLETRYMFKYNEAKQEYIGKILDEDVTQFLFLVNLIFTSRGLESTYQTTIYKRIHTTFLGKYDRTVQFYFRHFQTPDYLETKTPPDPAIKKLVLLQTHINKNTDVSIVRDFPNVEELEFRKLNTVVGSAPIKFEIFPKINKVNIRFVQSVVPIRFKFYNVPGAYNNLTNLYLEDCEILNSLSLEGCPLRKLYLLKVKSLKMLHLKKLTQIEDMDLHLIEPCHLIFDEVQVDNFNIECSDTAEITFTDEDIENELNWTFSNFEIEKVKIKLPQIFRLFLNNKIKTKKPIPYLKFQGFLGDVFTKHQDGCSSLVKLIENCKCIGVTTNLSFLKILNFQLSESLSKFIKDGVHVKQLIFRVC